MNNPNSRLMIFLLALLLIMVLLLGYLRHAEARETFNTHALELDSPARRSLTYPPLPKPMASYRALTG